MTCIATAERDKYIEAWRNPVYGAACYSLDLWHNRREIFPTGFKSAIDLGCGPGLILNEWTAMGVDCLGVDIADNCLHPSVPKKLFVQDCLWTMYLGRRFDLGVSTDVLEHIPSKYVGPTLHNMWAHCDALVLKIAHVPDVCGGGKYHLTVKNKDWWEEWLGKYTAYSKIEFLGFVNRSGFEDSLWRCS